MSPPPKAQLIETFCHGMSWLWYTVEYQVFQNQSDFTSDLWKACSESSGKNLPLLKHSGLILKSDHFWCTCNSLFWVLNATSPFQGQNVSHLSSKPASWLTLSSAKAKQGLACFLVDMRQLRGVGYFGTLQKHPGKEEMANNFRTVAKKTVWAHLFNVLEGTFTFTQQV